LEMNHSDSSKRFSETDIKMLEILTTYLLCLVDKFKKTVGIPMNTNCAPLLVDVFLYSY
jgi:hypothetical protein